MPTHASPIKQQRKSRKRHLRNQAVLSSLKTWVKKLNAAVTARKPDEARSLLKITTTAFDRAASKGIVPPNTAARKVSRLTIKVNKLLSAEKAA
jgi:small subunit ribosomal protein S20